MNNMTQRKATELDVNNVFVFEGRCYKVVSVGEFFQDPEQGNFQSLTCVNVTTGETVWCPLRASTIVPVALV